MHSEQPVKNQIPSPAALLEGNEPARMFGPEKTEARAYAETYVEQAARDGLTYRQAAILFRHLANQMEQRPVQLAVNRPIDRS